MSGAAAIPPDENRGPEILAVCGALVGLALVVVLLRVYVRARMVRHLGLDDYTIIAAMLVMFVEMMVIIPQVNLGGGRHVQYIKPEENVTKGLHLNFVTQPLCLIALCLTKVSVGFFLLRLTPSPRFRWVVIGTMIFTVLSASGNFLTSAVAGILSLGIFAAVAAIVKITFLGTYGQHGDFLWDSADITIWTTIEINVAIIAASIPCLKPLFKTLLDGTSARYYGSSKYKRYAHHPDDDNTTPQHHHPTSNSNSKATKSTSTARSAGRASRRLSIAILNNRAAGGPEFEMYGSGGGANSSSAVGVGTAASASGKFSTEIKSTGSEESILPQADDGDRGWGDGGGAGAGGGGITKTSTVVVKYDEEGEGAEARRSGVWRG
ncbi:hypothetical protein F5144DRAFT_488900 [Chaetomium tenue]|uniref:Uncharacterized protein n=1 Tax=Chaetomium tenue TaxID=1854479 RepID=A0ACB7P8F6_9PEZI|nr:hypothetical protein F5144DRAFT_488900 [Chaetomium globosum]